jgi:hypothetical protein
MLKIKNYSSIQVREAEVDRNPHENFQKNILAHQIFKETFEAKKLIKLNEKVAPGKEKRG